jgi:hypothetical protein
MDKETKKLLAEIVDGIATTDRRVHSLTVSLMAMRAVFQEIDKSGQFEQIYAKHCAVATAELLDQSGGSRADFLLELAKRLRS